MEKAVRDRNSTGAVREDFPELAKKFVRLARIVVDVSGDGCKEELAVLSDILLEFAGHLDRLCGEPAVK
jgi:hypothetical protein